jgi:hypothetical protein
MVPSFDGVDADEIDAEVAQQVEQAVEAGLVEAAHENALAAAGLVVETVEERAEAITETAADDDPVAHWSVCPRLHARTLAAGWVSCLHPAGRFTQDDRPAG